MFSQKKLLFYLTILAVLLLASTTALSSADSSSTDTGLYDPSDGVFHLRGEESFRYGSRDSDRLPVAGHWTGDGTAEVGLYDPSDGVFHLQYVAPFRYGPRGSTWLPVAGDWTGDGTAEVGLYDPSDGVFHLQYVDPFRYGPRGSTWLPVTGDWTGDGTAEVGLYDPSDGVFHLQYVAPFRYGPRDSTWLPVAGDWTGGGTAEVGLYDPSDGVFHLQGVDPFRFGPRSSSWLPVSGKWVTEVNRTIDSAEIVVREGSIEYGYTFKDGEEVVDWNTAVSNQYLLDAEVSQVILLNNGNPVGNTVSLQALNIVSSEGESGKTVFTDFDDMLNTFGIEIDEDDPASFELVPTHVSIAVNSTANADNPWSKEQLQQIPEDMIPELPDLPEDPNYFVAAGLSEFQYNKELVNQYYDESAGQMSNVDMGTADVQTFFELTEGSLGLLQNVPMLQNVPQEFLEPLPAGGSIPAPPGACPAAADPSVTFVTKAGADITPALLGGIKVIPTAMIMANQDDPDSLAAEMMGLIDMTDQQLMQQLLSKEGWNEHLWAQLEEKQAAALSLMDYQLWNVSSGIEEQAVALFRAGLEAAQIPEEYKEDILTAFDNSSKSGWSTNIEPTDDDAFARMDIVAELTGNISGTVYEQRAFSIPGVGQPPVYGIQTGYGTVNFAHPELGEMAFDVTIELDEFDENGRAIAGEVIAVDEDNGYESRFIFKDDATKEGNLYLNGELVGKLTMTVDAERFENYIDYETNEEMPLN